MPHLLSGQFPFWLGAARTGTKSAKVFFSNTTALRSTSTGVGPPKTSSSTCTRFFAGITRKTNARIPGKRPIHKNHFIRRSRAGSAPLPLGKKQRSAFLDRLRTEIAQNRPFASQAEEAILNLMRTADCLQRAFQHATRPWGITSTQYNVLRILRGAHPRRAHLLGHRGTHDHCRARHYPAPGQAQGAPPHPPAPRPQRPAHFLDAHFGCRTGSAGSHGRGHRAPPGGAPGTPLGA